MWSWCPLHWGRLEWNGRRCIPVSCPMTPVPAELNPPQSSQHCCWSSWKGSLLTFHFIADLLAPHTWHGVIARVIAEIIYMKIDSSLVLFVCSHMIEKKQRILQVRLCLLWWGPWATRGWCAPFVFLGTSGNPLRASHLTLVYMLPLIDPNMPSLSPFPILGPWVVGVCSYLKLA